MRNIQLSSRLIQRVSYLNASRSFTSQPKPVLTSSLLAKSSTCTDQQKRHSSHGGQTSEFGKNAMIYTVMGAGLVGVTLAWSAASEDSKPQPVDPPAERTYYTTPSSKAQVEEEEEVVVEVEDESVVVVSEPESTPQAEKKNTDEAPAKTNNKFLPDIPSHAQYLIVGGGTAAMSAFKAIRASDPGAKVLIVTKEAFKPYMRPPLSKDMWQTEDDKLTSELKFKQYNGNERSLFFLEDEFYVEPKFLNEQEHGGVAVVTGRRVAKVDVQAKTVRLDNAWEIAYDKCLIATGGRPKNLPIFEKEWEKGMSDKVTLFRSIADFQKLHNLVKEGGKTIAIIGGGFLGSELACAIGALNKKHGGEVVQLFPETGNLRRVLPQYLSEWTTQRVREEGVTVVPKANVTGCKLNDNKVELNLEAVAANGPKAKWLLADHVVVAVGLDPNIQLAATSGLETDPTLGGYVVNAELQARNNVWVAGDAACFYDINLGRRRVEHHDHAVVSGRLAGENMTGAGKAYYHQSMFWSDLGPKIGFEAIGLVDSSLQTIGLFAGADATDTPEAQQQEALRTDEKSAVATGSSDLKAPASGADGFGKGVVFYLRDEVIVGCLMWNVFKRIPVARQLIQSGEKLTDYTEMGKLFKINAVPSLEEGSSE